MDMAKKQKTKVSNSKASNPTNSGIPEFHKLYPHASQADLSPRNAMALWVVATEMYDFANSDIDEICDGGTPIKESFVLGGLPPICRNADKVWLQRFAQCFKDMAEKLQKGLVPYPTCTGEEVALHLALTVLEDDSSCATGRKANLDTISMDAALAEAYETCGRSATDLDVHYLREILFEDWDYQYLYNMEDDGIEDSEVGAMLGIGNLTPKKWFLPFRP